MIFIANYVIVFWFFRGAFRRFFAALFFCNFSAAFIIRFFTLDSWCAKKTKIHKIGIAPNACGKVLKSSEKQIWYVDNLQWNYTLFRYFATKTPAKHTNVTLKTEKKMCIIQKPLFYTHRKNVFCEYKRKAVCSYVRWKNSSIRKAYCSFL